VRCEKGLCGRGPCESGFFDFDEKELGCETECAGRLCTHPSGTQVTLTSAPIPEAGLTAQELSSGTSVGPLVQTSKSHSNFAVLGEPTPPLAGGAVFARSATHQNVGGFSAAAEK
jgi:hypothetical protein